MNFALSSLCRRPFSQPQASPTSLPLYCDTFPSKKSSLITTCPILSLLTQFMFLQSTFFSLYDIRVFVYYLSLPFYKSFRNSGLGLLSSPDPTPQHPEHYWAHRSSKLLFEEIDLTPKDTNHLSSTFRKQHFPTVATQDDITQEAKKWQEGATECPP